MAGALLLVLALSACTGEGDPDPISTEPAITTPQAVLEGEWIVTRTVTDSDDTANPSRIVGAESVRLVQIEQEECEAAVCLGTVSSGVVLEERETTTLEQTDGGLSWEFVGALDCYRAGTTTVQAANAFEFTQRVELTVSESVDVDGTLTATALVGTMTLTDTIVPDAADFGCTREPATAEVEYSVVAVRAPAA